MPATRSAIHARVDSELEAHLTTPARGATETLALACRILAAAGHGSGLAGQVTSRADEGTYWTLPLGVGFDEAAPTVFLRVDEQVRTVEGGGIANPAVRFHVWIYRARPDVRSIVHTHPPAASALSMIGQPLAVAHMDAAMLYDDCAYLPDWPGVPIADDEGRMISEALGGKRAILLANHGLLTAGATVEEATYLAYFMERAARLQLDALAAGDIKPVDPEHGRAAHDFLLKPEIVRATFAYLARQIERD